MNYGDLGIKRSAVMCILKSKDNYLLLKRAKEPFVGKYIPVGGKVDPFEAIDDAARREVYEEVGVKVKDVKLCGIMVETSPAKVNYVNFIYTIEADYFVPQECDEGILEWVNVKNLSTVPTPTTDAFIYKYVANNYFFVLDAIYDDKIELQTLKDRIKDEVIYLRGYHG